MGSLYHETLEFICKNGHVDVEDLINYFKARSIPTKTYLTVLHELSESPLLVYRNEGFTLDG